MKSKIGCIVLTILLFAALLPVYTTAAHVSDFSDVSHASWYYEAVNYAVSENLFTGTGSASFSPESPMTRAMLVTVLGKKTGAEIFCYSNA